MVGKVISKICNILIIVFMIVAVLTAGILIVPRFFGYQMYGVLSGSMEPYFHVGSVVFVDTKATTEDVQDGDPITFYLEDGNIVTHRIVEKDTDNRQFITKGDANESEDISPVPFERLIGKAAFSIPMIGYITLQIKTKQGMMAAAAVLIVLILLYLIPELLKPEDPKEKEEAERKKAEKAAKKQKKSGGQ